MGKALPGHQGKGSRARGSLLWEPVCFLVEIIESTEFFKCDYSPFLCPGGFPQGKDQPDPLEKEWVRSCILKPSAAAVYLLGLSIGI